MKLMQFSFELWSVFLAALTPVAIIATGVWHDRKVRGRTTRAPQQERLLRPAGHSLAVRLSKAGDDLFEQIAIICGVFAIAGLTIGMAGRFWGAIGPGGWSVGTSVAATGLIAFGGWRIQGLFRCLEEMRRIRLGLRGEQAVAEAAEELGFAGYRAFHDLPGSEIKPSNQSWNIDHVLIGSRGLFVLESKARMRRSGAGTQLSHEVRADGERLIFSTSYDEKAIPEAKRNARDLGAWLTKRTGEPVTVDWLVVIPGYFVKTDQQNAGHVMNAKYLVKFLAEQPERIAPAQVRRIIAGVDEICRDVEF